MVQKSYRYRLYPTDEQKVFLAKSFGCCRFVYNWALQMRISLYEQEKKFISKEKIIRRLDNVLKAENEWLGEVNSQSLQSTVRNLGAAYKNFFRTPGKVGVPRFKSKHGPQSFQNPQHCSVDFKNGVINIPKTKGIPAALHRRFNGKVKTVTISLAPSGKYYASVLVECDVDEAAPMPVNADTTIGVDLGVKTLAVCSDGREFGNPKNLEKALKRLKREQKRLCRKKKGSSNRNKARIKVARIHEHIANQRHDHLHKVTHALTHDSQVRTVCMEDLNAKGMAKNHKIARSVNDAAFGMFHRMMEYKCRWYGVNLIRIGRFEPSSKTCGHCGLVYKNLALNDRHWTCPVCGTLHDRDLNAARNIKEFGLRALPSERGDVKSVDCPPVDDRRPRRPKKQWQGEAEKASGPSARMLPSLGGGSSPLEY